MNICIISPEFPPLTNWGGIATFNFNLAQILADLKHRVFILTFNPNLDKYYRIKVRKTSKKKIQVLYSKFHFGNKILNFWYFRFPFGIVRLIAQKIIPDIFFLIEWNLFTLINFWRLQKQIKINVIHTPDYFTPALLTKLFLPKIPLIVHSQGPQMLFNQYEPPYFQNKIKALIESLYVQHCAQIVVTCSRDLEFFWKNRSLKQPVVTIPNFIKTEDYQRHDQNKTTPKKPTTLFFIGRLQYRKGADLLLKAFIKLAEKWRNLEIVFIGRDEKDFKLANQYVYFKELVNKTVQNDQIKKRIVLTGHLNKRTQLVNYIHKKNSQGIFILPARYEPFGFVIIEAMAMGLLVIASKQGGPKEIIKDGYHGILVKPQVSELIRVIEDVLSNRKKYEPFLLRAKKMVNNQYSFKAVKNSYLNLYKNLWPRLE